MIIKLKRVYDQAEESDGHRILIDRLWPRGLKKDEVKVDEWLKNIAPSDQLRKWYSHDVVKWLEFKRRYTKELTSTEELIRPLIEKAAVAPLTLVYAAKDEEHNNAVVLKEYIENSGSKELQPAE